MIVVAKQSNKSANIKASASISSKTSTKTESTMSATNSAVSSNFSLENQYFDEIRKYVAAQLDPVKDHQKYKVITMRNRSIKFPVRLMYALDHGDENVFTWSEDGKAFIIRDTKRLEKEILPKNFKDAKFNSFLRKLYRWGFVKKSEDQSVMKYLHPNFQQGKYSLCMSMTCTDSTKARSIRIQEEIASFQAKKQNRQTDNTSAMYTPSSHTSVSPAPRFDIMSNSMNFSPGSTAGAVAPPHPPSHLQQQQLQMINQLRVQNEILMSQLLNGNNNSNNNTRMNNAMNSELLSNSSAPMNGLSMPMNTNPGLRSSVYHHANERLTSPSRLMNQGLLTGGGGASSSSMMNPHQELPLPSANSPSISSGLLTSRTSGANHSHLTAPIGNRPELSSTPFASSLTTSTNQGGGILLSQSRMNQDLSSLLNHALISNNNGTTNNQSLFGNNPANNNRMLPTTTATATAAYDAHHLGRGGGGALTTNPSTRPEFEPPSNTTFAGMNRIQQGTASNGSWNYLDNPSSINNALPSFPPGAASASTSNNVHNTHNIGTAASNLLSTGGGGAGGAPPANNDHLYDKLQEMMNENQNDCLQQDASKRPKTGHTFSDETIDAFNRPNSSSSAMWRRGGQYHFDGTFP